MTGNAVVVNFSGGETSPRSRARFDQPWYQTSARRMRNFIAEVQGPARFRPGFVFLRLTRGGQTPRLVDFVVDDVTAYILEFTPLFVRLYQQDSTGAWDLASIDTTTVTGISRANPGIIAMASVAALSNGDEIILTDVAGMPEINNRQFKLAAKSGSTFRLTDPVTGNAIDTSAFGVYTSGGTVKKVTEIATPYTASDLTNLMWASSTNVMYLTTGTTAPRKVTVDSTGGLSIATFSRTNDPFATPSAPTINPRADTAHTAVTLGTQTQIHFRQPDYALETISYDFSGFVGTVQLNGNSYKLAYETSYAGNDGFSYVVYFLKNAITGADIDSSAFGAYVSGGTIAPTANTEYPRAVAFYEGRLGYFGSNQRPDCFWLSRPPVSTTGNSRYDDFTGGSTADFACFFQLAPVAGGTDFISWARGGPSYLFIGTLGGPYRISGSGLDIPITPSSINVRQFDTAGAEATHPAGLQQMFFVQRGGTTLRAIKVINPFLATFESDDMCLNAEQVGYSPIQRAVLQRGRPDAIWVYREDGLLAGMSAHLTSQASDAITGWHLHELGGTGKVVDISIMPRQSGFDQLFVAAQRTVGGVTRCSVEIMADDVVFPDVEDFYAKSGPIVKPSDDPNRINTSAVDGSRDADLALWQNAVWRLQERYVHSDSQAAYDGSLRGTLAAATLTPSAVGVPQVAGQAATAITLTASAAVFVAGDVGSEIWVKPNATTGVAGAGRATITAYVDTQHVTATVTVPFTSTAAVAAGDWYFAVSTFYGYSHLAGVDAAVVGDGAVLSDGGQSGDDDFPVITVSASGTITLPTGDLGVPMRAAVLRAGFPYLGQLETHNLEMGGRSGPAQSKPRSISEINIRFMSSLGCEYGTDLYKMQKVNHRLTDAISDRPAPVFSGIRRLKLEDSWSGLEDFSREKNVFVTQRLPLPAVVQFLDLSYSTADDGGVE